MIINVNTATGVQSVWKQERLILRVQSAEGNTIGLWTNLHGNYGNPLARYIVPSSDVLDIDMTDYIRTYPFVTRISVYDDTEMTVQVSVVGLINPQGVLIPPHDLDAFGAVIVPPSKIIIDGTQSENVTCEFYGSQGIWSVTGFASISADKRFIGQIDDYFVLSNGTQSHLYMPILMQDCARYALVQWVSFTGVQRVAYFEVRGPKSAVSDAYQLQPIDNEYIEIKGRADGLVLALDGLNAYDVWYYSDVVLSSKVEISLDGGQTFDRVQVTTKEVETPDFVANGKVEITVNWRRYDAVDL